MQEIMILRKNVDNEPRLKTLLVDDNVLARLTKIRGNLYRDDSRLRTMADIPTMQQQQTPEPEPKISPEMRKRAEEAWHLHCMMQAAGERATTVTPAQPQPERPKTPEETWRYSPALRAEFNNNLGAYLAYCKAAKSGRCKAYGV